MSASGLTCSGTTCTGTYARTGVAPAVSVTATPAASSTLSWSGGGCTGSTSPCSVTMDANKTVTATFTLQSFQLNVTNHFVYGAGGSVTSSPSGISCGGTCGATYQYGTSVTLTAAPTSPNVFQGWSGDCSGNATTCTLTMTQAHNVTAIFKPNLNYVFVTSTKQNANFGGLAGADQLCAVRATAAGLPGTYRAFLATSTASAASRLNGARGWLRTDGLPFADSTTSLFTNHQVFYPPATNELGVNILEDIAIYTGTDGSGNAYPNYTCADWTSTNGYGESGDAMTGSVSWEFESAVSCNVLVRLYCFEVDYNTPLTITPISGAIAFETKSVFDAKLGITGADALCNQEAQANGLTIGTYKAMLDTATASAASRFNLANYGSGGWVRPDGIAATVNYADLFKGFTYIQASINEYADKSYSGGTNVWVGGAGDLSNPGTAANTCNSWATDASTSSAGVYTDTNTYYNFGYAYPEDCAQNMGGAAHLICLQD